MKKFLVRKLVLASLVLPLAALSSAAQTTPPQPEQLQNEKPATSTTDEKSEKILQKAIQALGGDSYLKIRTVTGKGFITDYKDGVSQIPLRFVDYIVYPDKERTEFSGGGARHIQTNDRDKGWVYDGAALTLKDQTPTQLEEFRLATRTGFESLLRGTWRTQGATLSYVGRREAGVGRRNETVRVTYPDGFSAEYEFAATDGLPAKILYKRKIKKPDTEEEEELTEEDRVYKPITVDGAIAFYVMDHFRNGIQTSRINYESVEYNKALPDSLFAKPANFKAVK